MARGHPRGYKSVCATSVEIGRGRSSPRTEDGKRGTRHRFVSCRARVRCLYFVVAGTAATSDDVVTAFEESLTEAFGWKSAVKFDFVDIGAELDRHKIRHIFPVEVSTSSGFFAFALLTLI